MNMPQKVLKFAGINRKVNEFQNSGACEELINLRPDVNGGHHVVKPKRIKQSNVRYESFYVHSFGATNNEIAVTTDGLINWMNPTDGGVSIITSGSGKLSVCFAGNVMLVYDEGEKKNLAFKFEDGEYKQLDAFAPNIHAFIDYRSMDDQYMASADGYAEGTTDEISVDAYNEALQKAVSKFYEVHKNGLCGSAVVGCTCELEDGSEIWSTAFVVASNEQYKRKTPRYSMNEGLYRATVYGTKETRLCINVDELPSVVKKVNVYATKPVFRYRYLGHATEQSKALPLEDLELSGQLMYYQGSIDAKDTSSSLLLDFSSSKLGEDIMDVTAGCIERIGPAISYNNRFHFYRSEVQHAIQTPTLSSTIGGDETASPWLAYVNFDGKWKLIDYIFSFSESKELDVIYPMSDIKEIVFVKGSFDGSWFECTYDSIVRVSLKNSTAYNYSYAFGVTPSVESGNAFKQTIIDAGQLWHPDFEYDTKILQREEINAINVSVPYNPFAFSVNASYSVGGEIKDLVPSYVPISSTQIGQYPLTVFTTNGVFSMEQGSGVVLYGNIIPLQPTVIDGKAVSTPHGTFFISSKNLYLISGRDSANVSYVLNGELELTLRELESYKKLCCNGRDFFDFSPILSDKEFELFMSSDVALVYDQLNNELYISNKDNVYSYVLNLDTKTYHKIAKKYMQFQSGARYAIEIDGGTRNIVDLHEENDGVQHILLQSRPMSFEVAFTHIQRLILLADAKLEKSQNLCFSVFASDNLYDWKCIISAQKQNTILRQIRTNRAAKSYRDYVILITGTVDTDTDISDIIADYTIVNRRLG